MAFAIQVAVFIGDKTEVNTSYQNLGRPITVLQVDEPGSALLSIHVESDAALQRLIDAALKLQSIRDGLRAEATS